MGSTCRSLFIYIYTLLLIPYGNTPLPYMHTHLIWFQMKSHIFSHIHISFPIFIYLFPYSYMLRGWIPHGNTYASTHRFHFIRFHMETHHRMGSFRMCLYICIFTAHSLWIFFWIRTAEMCTYQKTNTYEKTHTHEKTHSRLNHRVTLFDETNEPYTYEKTQTYENRHIRRNHCVTLIDEFKWAVCIWKYTYVRKDTCIWRHIQEWIIVWQYLMKRNEPYTYQKTHTHEKTHTFEDTYINQSVCNIIWWIQMSRIHMKRHIHMRRHLQEWIIVWHYLMKSNVPYTYKKINTYENKHTRRKHRVTSFDEIKWAVYVWKYTYTWKDTCIWKDLYKNESSFDIIGWNQMSRIHMKTHIHTKRHTQEWIIMWQYLMKSNEPYTYKKTHTYEKTHTRMQHRATWFDEIKWAVYIWKYTYTRKDTYIKDTYIWKETPTNRNHRATLFKWNEPYTYEKKHTY